MSGAQPSFDHWFGKIHSVTLVNWLLRYQVDGPEDQEGYYALDYEIGPDHLLQAGSSNYARKGDDGKEQAVYRDGNGIGGEDPRPLRPISPCSLGPEVVDPGIDQLGQQRRQDRANDDPHLQREYRVPPRARGVYYAEEKCPGSLASIICPIRLRGQQNHQLKIEGSKQVEARRQPDGGDSSLLPELLMDQVPPGEGQRIYEAGIHDQAAEIGDLGGGNVSCQREEQVQPAENYGGLCLVDPKPASQELGSFRRA